MPQVAEIAWHISGDMGGLGVSRLRFIRQNAGNILGADVNAAAAASFGLFNAAKAATPSGMTWAIDPQVNVYDSDTGLVQGPMVISSMPSNVGGTGGNNWAAGVGARINWKTSTVQGRRLMKGATYIVPLGALQFVTGGGVSPGFVTSMNTAAAAYLTAMTTALLYPVVWHRPPKGTHTGGLTGIVFSGVCSTVPASLRSRRE